MPFAVYYNNTDVSPTHRCDLAFPESRALTVCQYPYGLVLTDFVFLLYMPIAMAYSITDVNEVRLI